jgi:hypothetical protein
MAKGLRPIVITSPLSTLIKNLSLTSERICHAIFGWRIPGSALTAGGRSCGFNGRAARSCRLGLLGDGGLCNPVNRQFLNGPASALFLRKIIAPILQPHRSNIACVLIT